MADTSLIFILDAQLPFIRHPENPGCLEESWLFNALTYTYIPLLRTCTSLETEGVPFKLAIAFSPALCEMFADHLLQERYIETLDAAINFGFSELSRCSGSPEMRELIKIHLDHLQLNRRDFVEIYEKNILQKFDYFATRGYIEILATTATSCFLPLYTDIPEAINAQIETGLITYRKHFTASPSGFWLPAMGYSKGLETVLRSYGFQYTILESHGLLFADPPPEGGIFTPAYCQNGFAVFGRDKNSYFDVADSEKGHVSNPVYLDVEKDIGFELDKKTLSPLFDVSLGRRITGFRYWSRNKNGKNSASLYQIDKAHNQVCTDASFFLDRRSDILNQASEALGGAPVLLVSAFPASLFGQNWYEGISWLENVFRLAADRNTVSFSLFSSKITSKPSVKRIDPYYSSWTNSGYAEEFLNSSNDWMYPYIRKATQRMIDLAERFPDDTGLKERALNMAARELLLAQSMDWFLLMNQGDQTEYARRRFEDSVRSFTVVYESLGSNFVSTQWLTNTEKQHNLFTDINYRVFSKKK